MITSDTPPAIDKGKQDCQSQPALCFCEWLTIELAPTIQGSKPSTILSLADFHGQKRLTLWKRYGPQLFRQATVRFLILRRTPGTETVLFYRPDILERCMMQATHQSFLTNLGYPVERGVEACLEVLRQQFQYACPHEIGLILGIPLKDVLGFMGLSDLPLTCRKEWCIYGNPQESITAIQRFAQERLVVLEHLMRGVTCYEILCGKLGEVPKIAPDLTEFNVAV